MKKISDLIDAYQEKNSAYLSIAELLEDPETAFLFDHEELERLRSEASDLQKEMHRLKPEIMAAGEITSDMTFFVLMAINTAARERKRKAEALN